MVFVTSLHRALFSSALASMASGRFLTPTELNGSPDHCTVHAIRSIYFASTGKLLNEKECVQKLQHGLNGSTPYDVVLELNRLGLNAKLYSKHTKDQTVQGLQNTLIAMSIVDSTKLEEHKVVTLQHIRTLNEAWRCKLVEVKTIENCDIEPLMNSKKCVVVSVCGPALIKAVRDRLAGNKSNVTELGSGHSMIITKITKTDGKTIFHTAEDPPFDKISDEEFDLCRAWYNTEGDIIVVG